MALDIELQAISRGYDRKTCWVHARPAAIPGEPPRVIVTMQKLRLTGSDVFYALNDMRTDDGGKSWTGPVEHADALGRRLIEGGIEEGICDFWPEWHAKSKVVLGTGHTTHYLNDDHPPRVLPSTTGYSVYHPASGSWSPWKRLDLSAQPKFVMSGAGCTQRVDLPNGDVLLPVYYRVPETVTGTFEFQCVSTVLRCAFDGETLRYVEHGTEMTRPTGRGIAEPSLAFFQGRFYLTLRNNDRGYIATGKDGLHFDEPKPWTFDDGSDLGSYNTQQHWVTMPDALYLSYTRRGANNDHVPRNRAPLFIAQVDTGRLCVIRKTEQIVAPERGAGLGNFGVTRVRDNESWIVVSEWMQTNPPDPHDSTVCERYGSDNSVFVARVRSVR